MPDYSDLIDKHFRRVGLDPAWGRKIMQIESSGDASNVTGKNEHYVGLFQLDKEEFRKGGGTGDRKDPEMNTMAAANVMAQHARDFKQRTGKDVNLIDLYMIHQQGAAGYAAHVNNPDAPAWQNFKKASGWSDDMAKQAIWGNLGPEAKKKFGSVENITSGDFVGQWGENIAGTTYTPSHGPSIASVRGQRPGIGEDPLEDKADKQAKADMTPNFQAPRVDVPSGIETPSISLPRGDIDTSLPAAPTIRSRPVQRVGAR